MLVGLWGFAGGVPRAQERIGTSCSEAVATTLCEALLQIRRLLGLAEAADKSKAAEFFAG
jgi:hypothetical protein